MPRIVPQDSGRRIRMAWRYRRFRKSFHVLPFTIIRKPLFRLVRFRVETIPINEALAIPGGEIVLEQRAQYFRSIGADVIIQQRLIQFFAPIPPTLRPLIWNLSRRSPQTEKALWNKLSSSHRRKIRLAYTKAGVTIKRVSVSLEPVYKLVRDTFKIEARFHGLCLLQKIKFSPHGENVKVFVAEHQGILKAV